MRRQFRIPFSQSSTQGFFQPSAQPGFPVSLAASSVNATSPCFLRKKSGTLYRQGWCLSLWSVLRTVTDACLQFRRVTICQRGVFVTVPAVHFSCGSLTGAYAVFFTDNFMRIAALYSAVATLAHSKLPVTIFCFVVMSMAAAFSLGTSTVVVPGGSEIVPLSLCVPVSIVNYIVQ